jgi:MFS family permease
LLTALHRWFADNILELGREMRLSYLPPLMVYVAAGVSGLTGIVGTFFVKEYLGLSAAFLAALGFWAGIPWALKMPLGHLVDLIWRHKAGLVWLGATLIAASLLIMLGLVASPLRMGELMSLEAWFVLSALLSPVGYVLQDVVADAMTVEAVPRVDEHGQPLPPEQRRLMNTTLQTLGRVAIIGGGVLVSLVNVFMFQGVESLPKAAKAAVYAEVYGMALVIPAISVAGVLLATLLRRREARRLRARGFDEAALRTMLQPALDPVRPNWWILGGSLVFVAISLSVGLAQVEFSQEIVFVSSFAVITFLMAKLLRELDEDARRTLLGTAIVIFVFRAMPGPGAGSTWWMIDSLGFDQSFLAQLSLIASVLTLFGLFLFRRFMGERSIAYIVGFLTLIGTLLSLPTLGMYYGLHEWTAAHTGGVVDARFIALIDTALESPLGQIAMVPMLAWIANSAPANLKATYFAVMASFTNLALSAAQLGTKYLNQIFEVTREVRDPVTNAIKVPADYGDLGALFMVAIALGLILPFMAIWVTRLLKLRSA